MRREGRETDAYMEGDQIKKFKVASNTSSQFHPWALASWNVIITYERPTAKSSENPCKARVKTQIQGCANDVAYRCKSSPRSASLP